MKKIALILLLTLLSTTLMPAQDSDARLIDWKLLAKVEFKDKYYEEFEAWYLYPEFSEKVQNLDGRQVIIEGYVIPLDMEAGIYALSAYPFSSCFFCGGAGPESVMSLQFNSEKAPRYKTDDVVRFTGRLRLNDSDVEDFNYILEEAREVK